MTGQPPYFIAKVSEEKDFFRLKDMTLNHDGWSLDYDKTTVKVWTKHVDDSSFNMVKDPEYRKTWDSHMIVGIEIGYLNSNNDISYYAMRCPRPIKNRDLVLQKSWFHTGSEYFIINHSVCHKDYPPQKGFIRAVSYFTGYYIKCTPLENGCELNYVTRSDPQGDLPSWLVNRCTQILAPRYMKQVEKAASLYRAWKTDNNPNFKPWIHPEQIQAPKVTTRDCMPSEDELAINPFLKKYKIEHWLEAESHASKGRRVDDARSKPIKSTHQSTSQSEEPAFEGGSRQSRAKSNAASRGDRRKSRNRLNTILNFTKICVKRSEED